MAETERTMRPVLYVGRSAKELRGLPDKAQDRLIADLRRVQLGMAPRDEKALRGFKENVRELRARTGEGWHRLVYASNVIPAVAALHAFTKTTDADTARAAEVCRDRLKLLRRSAGIR
jgi:phage-related protein